MVVRVVQLAIIRKLAAIHGTHRVNKLPYALHNAGFREDKAQTAKNKRRKQLSNPPVKHSSATFSHKDKAPQE